MNKDVLTGNWKELKGSVKQQWGKLTDDEITRTEGDQEKLVGLLQKSYGYSKEKAEQEYQKFAAQHR